MDGAKRGLLDRTLTKWTMSGRTSTPYGQSFAWEVRQLLEPLPGAYGSRWGTHVAIIKPKFFNGHIDGINYATVLANWYFGRPGLVNVIDHP